MNQMTKESGNRSEAFSIERLERIKDHIKYEPETGNFIWTNPLSPAFKAGTIAGHLEKYKGYVRITVAGYSYKASSLAWYFVYGEYTYVDHINRIKHDNRIANLRKATHQQNMANQDVRCTNLLGVKGVQQRGKRYRAYITVSYCTIHLGTFDTVEEASQAYKEAAELYFGEFANG